MAIDSKAGFQNYKFYTVRTCNMCGSNSINHKVIAQRLNKSTAMKPKRKHGISVMVLKYRKCGLIFSDPMPVPNDIQNHYSPPPETYWKTELFERDENYFSKEINELKKPMTITNSMKALDIDAVLGNAGCYYKRRALMHTG